MVLLRGLHGFLTDSLLTLGRRPRFTPLSWPRRRLSILRYNLLRRLAAIHEDLQAIATLFEIPRGHDLYSSQNSVRICAWVLERVRLFHAG